MDYRQYRAAAALCMSAATMTAGNCLLLEDGGSTCVCVYKSAFALLCRWFYRPTVLPLMRHWKPPLGAGKPETLPSKPTRI